MSYIFSVPCLMGTEGLVADELKFGGFEGVQSENGRVLFSGGIQEGARANVRLRCGERVLLRLARFPIHNFDSLFEGVKAIDWAQHIGQNDAFPVKGFSINSCLRSVPDCQKIIKKATVDRLKLSYDDGVLDETGSKRQIQFAIINDVAEIFLDTTGAPLYKRGYKLEQNEASIRETLAASMVKVSRWRGRENFYDPFCGSGTIAIEAAMAALSISPGARREFEAQHWNEQWAQAFAQQKQQAIEQEKAQPIPLIASDIDPEMVELTRQNARRAGVLEYITVEQADVLSGDWQNRAGVIMCNPPYGVRMMDKQSAHRLYGELGKAIIKNTDLKKYIISSDERFEEHFGKASDKRRKLYNGMIKCNLYMYFKG